MIQTQRPMAQNGSYPQTFGGKGQSTLEDQNPQKITIPGQGGQPEMGMPSQYSNTVGLGDNQDNQLAMNQSGKGKGA